VGGAHGQAARPTHQHLGPALVEAVLILIPTSFCSCVLAICQKSSHPQVKVKAQKLSRQ